MASPLDQHLAGADVEGKEEAVGDCFPSLGMKGGPEPQSIAFFGQVLAAIKSQGCKNTTRLGSYTNEPQEGATSS